MTTTQKQLEKLMREWQECLRLQDWNLTIRFVSSYRDKGLLPESHATCHAHTEIKKADITLIHPSAYEDPLVPEYDVELKVVHELLHLHMYPLGDVPDLALEQAIEAISRALVARKRKKKIYSWD